MKISSITGGSKRPSTFEFGLNPRTGSHRTDLRPGRWLLNVLLSRPSRHSDFFYCITSLLLTFYEARSHFQILFYVYNVCITCCMHITLVDDDFNENFPKISALFYSKVSIKFCKISKNLFPKFNRNYVSYLVGILSGNM